MTFEEMQKDKKQMEQKCGQIAEKSVADYYTEKKHGEYTLEDYYAIPEERRVELIDGTIYDMGSPSMIHQILCGEISRILREFILEKKGQCIVLQAPADVQLDCDDRTMLQPDIFVVCDRGKLFRSHLYGTPDLVIEVLSGATRKKDMGIKLGKYANAGVREYWLVDPDGKKIVVYDLEREKLPVIYGFEDSVSVRIFDGECEIDFAKIDEYVNFLYER